MKFDCESCQDGFLECPNNCYLAEYYLEDDCCEDYGDKWFDPELENDPPFLKEVK